MAEKKDLRELEVAEPFVSLFPVQPEVLALVTESMREHGFLIDKPILLWKDAFGTRGRRVVIDGHTRLQAARDLKLPQVWTATKPFKNTDAAITAGIGEQVIRRNLNREQIAAYVVSILPLLDEVEGGLRTRSKKQLAALLGVSTATVGRARGVIGSGDEELIEKVKDGRISLLVAYDITTGRTSTPKPSIRDAEVRARRAAPPPSDEEKAAVIADLKESQEPWTPEKIHAAVAELRQESLPVAPTAEPAVEAVAPTAEEQLVSILAALGKIDDGLADLREAALNVTVNAHGHKGRFLIAKLQFHPSGAIYAVNRAEKTIELHDITKVVKVPEAPDAS